jgi:hypothetical protein
MTMQTWGTLSKGSDVQWACPEYDEWFDIIGHHRDSDDLAESNWEVALERLGGESETVVIVRFGHWAVGWVEELFVAPNSPHLAIAEEMLKQLENYPILDEEHFCEKERTSQEERIKLMRRYPEEFDRAFENFGTLRDCVRGADFCGEPSLVLD